MVNMECNAKKKSKTFAVSGMVEQTSSYCGGARPSQAMVKDHLEAPLWEGIKIKREPPQGSEVPRRMTGAVAALILGAGAR